MELLVLKYPSKSAFLPEISVSLLKTTLSVDHVKDLIDVVLKKEPEILFSTKKRDIEQDETWLTGRLWEYNFLKFEEKPIAELEDAIREAYKTYCSSLGVKPESVIYVQCWANIIRKNGRFITRHNHAGGHAGAPEEYSYISGNISLQAIETGTYYKSPFIDYSYRIENVPGDVILFPSFVEHWTDKNDSETIRISIAFDIITEEVYDMIKVTNFKRVEV